MTRSVLLLATTLLLSSCSAKDNGFRAGARIVCAPGGSCQVALAAREVRRYFYLRTGELLPLREEPGGGDSIIVTQKADPALSGLVDMQTLQQLCQLQPQQYLLKTLPHGRHKMLLVVGGDAVGTLYGAYRLAERLGVGFYLHGDVVPDQQIAAALPDLDETGKPLFEIRGIQPFHDFPEGPDWWSTDDYLTYISQLAKMRMNFIGLHCYPEDGPGCEPSVWIGQQGDFDAAGRVSFSYGSSWDSTARNGWGNAPMKTSDFAAGASLLFENDTFGSPAMGDVGRPTSLEQCNRVFNSAGEMYQASFEHARLLGIKTCIGTETPLYIPKALQDRLRQQGKDPADPAVIRQLYEGTFRRLAGLYKPDYYWLWTPEGWTWGGNTAHQWEGTVRDIQTAQAALDALGKPFTLATCGWVLGPQHDRSALDKILPPGSPISCISRSVGHDPLDPGFEKITTRPKWAIPWFENDPNLTAPQPWVGRMRYDACDAKRLDCNGLIGIHWRTKVIGPNISALAEAAWDQSWAKPVTRPATPAVTYRGPVGALAQFTDPVAGTGDAAVYQSVRWGMSTYDVSVPSGTYTVTLKFNEPVYTQVGTRVFGFKVQGKQGLESLDIFARVGKNKALDLNFSDVKVTDGLLKLDFLSKADFPCLAGIVIEGKTDPVNQLPSQVYKRKINVGGGKYLDYEADPITPSGPDGGRERAMPVGDFYEHFARVSFGDEVAQAAGAIFSQIDGLRFPETATWTDGPGNIKISPQPWEQVKGLYQFVDELEALRPRVHGPGNLERFDYWLNTMRYTAAMAEVGSCRGGLDAAMKALAAEKDAARKKELAGRALTLRVQLARTWEKMLTFQLAATDTAGEMGTLANLERHNRVGSKFVTAQDAALLGALGQPLPANTQLSKAYAGPVRIIVPTIRTQVSAGQPLKLRLIVLDNLPAKMVALYWRPMGKGQFQRLEAKNLGRAVYQVTLPPATEDFEYYLQAQTAANKELVWPATAPQLNQTVVALP